MQRYNLGYFIYVKSFLSYKWIEKIKNEVTNLTTQLKIFNHLIDRQYAAEREMLQKYQQRPYSMQQPYIRLNPYLIAPLTAIVMFHTEQPVSITATIQGKKEDANIVLKFAETTEHVLELIGLYENMENHVTLLSSMGDTSQIVVQTTSSPVELLLPAIESCEPSIWNNQLVFMIPTDPQYLTAGYDQHGDCRWYTNQKFAYSMKRGQNGRILVGAPRLLAIPYSPTTLYEMSLVGKIYKEYCLPRGYHHSYFELKNQQMLFLTQNIEEGTSGDLIMLIDRNNANVLKVWDLKTVLPQDVAGSGSQDMHDWFHCNAIYYDERTDSLTVSGRHQDIIVNLDFTTGHINWMLGDPEGWPADYVNRYFLQPEGTLEWAYEPHSVQFLSEDMLLCFDSGHYRAKNPARYVAPEKNYSRAVVYQIDTVQKKVRQLWQYGKERGAEFYSSYMCNISVYKEKHISIHSGGSATVAGKAIDMPGIFHKDIDATTHVYATTIELLDGKEVCKIHVPSNTYQAERIALQDLRDKHVWGRGERLGDFAATEEFEVDIPSQTMGMIPEKYELSFGYDGERLFLRGHFFKAEMVLLHLQGEKENHCFYIQSTRRPFYTMCLVTWHPGDGRPVEWPITVKQFSDCYKLKVTINETTYETGLVLDLRARKQLCMI